MHYSYRVWSREGAPLESLSELRWFGLFNNTYSDETKKCQLINKWRWIMLAHILWIKYFVLNSWVLLICKHLHFLKLLKQTRINNGAFREKKHQLWNKCVQLLSCDWLFGTTWIGGPIDCTMISVQGIF